MHITIPAATIGLPPAFFHWLTVNHVNVPQISGAQPFYVYDDTVAGTTVMGTEFQQKISHPMDDYLAGWLLEKFGETDDGTTAIDDMAALYQQLFEARQAASDAKARADEARDQLLARLRQTGADIGTIDGRPALERKIVSGTRFATNRFRNDHPDLASEYTDATTTERLELL